jgi:hypothetical protein
LLGGTLSAFCLRKDCAKISPAVQHTDDLNKSVLDPIEDGVRVNQSGAQSWHQFVARSPSECVFRKALCRLVDFPQKLIGNLDSGNASIIPPDIA